MIQENLGRLWRRIQTYRYLLVMTIALNVLTATSGLVCGIYFWKGSFQLSDQIISQEENKSALLSIQKNINELKALPNVKRPSRTEALAELRLWENLRLRTENLNFDAAKNFPEEYFTDSKAGAKWLSELSVEINKQLESQRTEILKMAHRETALRSALLWILGLTLFFGVIVPMFVLGLLMKALRTAQNALTTTAKEIVHDWSVALNRYGEEPFKNAHFWVEAMLIITEQLGEQSRHPAAQLSAELSHLVRSELHKNQKDAA